MTYFADVDNTTGCAVVFDEAGDIRLIVPDGKMNVSRLGLECDACKSKNLSFAQHVANTMNSTQPAADERVAEHMRLVREACIAWGEWAHDNDPDCAKENAAISAVESSARALLAAGQEDAEHAAMYRWLREHGSDDQVTEVLDEFYCVTRLLQGDELDAAIRSAMQKGTP